MRPAALRAQAAPAGAAGGRGVARCEDSTPPGQLPGSAAPLQRRPLHAAHPCPRRTRSDEAARRGGHRVDKGSVAVQLRQRLAAERPHAQRHVVGARHKAHTRQGAQRPDHVARGLRMVGGWAGGLRGQGVVGDAWCTTTERLSAAQAPPAPARRLPGEAGAPQREWAGGPCAAAGRAAFPAPCAPDSVCVPLVRLRALAVHPALHRGVTGPRQQLALGRHRERQHGAVVALQRRGARAAAPHLDRPGARRGGVGGGVVWREPGVCWVLTSGVGGGGVPVCAGARGTPKLPARYGPCDNRSGWRPYAWQAALAAPAHLSTDADATAPPGSGASAVTWYAWPRSTASSRPLTGSHSRTVVSSEPGGATREGGRGERLDQGDGGSDASPALRGWCRRRRGVGARARRELRHRLLRERTRRAAVVERVCGLAAAPEMTAPLGYSGDAPAGTNETGPT